MAIPPELLALVPFLGHANIWGKLLLLLRPSSQTMHLIQTMFLAPSSLIA